MLALFAGLIDALTPCQYVFGWRLGIGELLFRDDPDAVATLVPGRSAPSAAVGFLLSCLALTSSA